MIAGAVVVVLAGCGATPDAGAPGQDSSSFNSVRDLGERLVSAGVCDQLTAVADQPGGMPAGATLASDDMTCRASRTEILELHFFAGSTALGIQRVGSCLVQGRQWQVVAPTRELADAVRQAAGGAIGECS